MCSNLKRQVALLDRTVRLVQEAGRFKGRTTYTRDEDARRPNNNVLSHIEIDAACPCETTDNLVRQVRGLELTVRAAAKSFTGQPIDEGGYRVGEKKRK